MPSTADGTQVKFVEEIEIVEKTYTKQATKISGHRELTQDRYGGRESREV